MNDANLFTRVFAIEMNLWGNEPLEFRGTFTEKAPTSPKPEPIKKGKIAAETLDEEASGDESPKRKDDKPGKDDDDESGRPPQLTALGLD